MRRAKVKGEWIFYSCSDKNQLPKALCASSGNGIGGKNGGITAGDVIGNNESRALQKCVTPSVCRCGSD